MLKKMETTEIKHSFITWMWEKFSNYNSKYRSNKRKD